MPAEEIRPIGILAVDDDRCLSVATSLAARPTEGLAALAAPPACGRPAGRPRGVTVLPEKAFHPARPFAGPLFAAIEAMALAGRLAAGAAGEPLCPCLALVVPVVTLRLAGAAGDASTDRRREPPERTPDDTPPPAALVVVTDHVGLSGRGPLAGPWPAGRPRTFPSMNGLYVPDAAAALLDLAAGTSATSACDTSPAQRTSTGARPEREPEDGRSPAGAAIYSRLAVAGVADTGRQTAFEAEQARAAGLTVASSCLVAPAVIAAYYGLAVAAVGVPIDEDTVAAQPAAGSSSGRSRNM